MRGRTLLRPPDPHLGFVCWKPRDTTTSLFFLFLLLFIVVFPVADILKKTHKKSPGTVVVLCAYWIKVLHLSILFLLLIVILFIVADPPTPPVYHIQLSR